MRISLKLGAGGLAFCWPALRACANGGRPSVGQWALVLCGVSLLLLAAAYRLHHAGKRVARAAVATAPRAALWQAVLLPWSAVAALVLLLCRLLTREALADEVAPGLWIGSAPLPTDGARLRARGIDAVLSLTAEFPDMAGLSRVPGLARTRVAMLDGVAPPPEDLSAAVDWATARRSEGRTVLVHCAQGHGRSGLVVAAALLREGLARTAAEAWAAVARARPLAGLAPDQRAALEAYAAATGLVGRAD